MRSEDGVAAQVITSAAEVPSERWEDVAHGAVRGISCRWARLIERSLIGAPRIEYVLIDDDRGPLANLAVGEPMRGNMPWIFQRTLWMTMFLVVPFTLGGGLALRPTDDLRTDLRALLRYLLRFARERGKYFLTIEGIREPLLPIFAEEGFLALPGSATTEVEVPEDYDTFLKNLRAKDRTELRRLGRRAAEAGITFSSTQRFADRSAELWPLLSRVFTSHGEKVPLREDVYANLAEVYGDDTVLFEARVGGQLAAVIAVIREKHIAKAVFPGLDYELSRKHNLYLLLYDQIMRWAIDNKVSIASAGNTAYEVKAQAGYKKIQLWTCYRAISPALNTLMPLTPPALHQRYRTWRAERSSPAPR